MTDTIPLVVIPANNVWVNVYAETGISVGTALTLKLYSIESGHQIDMAISAAEPTGDEVFPLRLSENSTSLGAGESGSWARSKYEALLSAQEG